MVNGALTFGSVCDGIGCGHLGFVNAGFACAWSAEIEPFPCAVLAHRFHGVPNHGDMNKTAGLVERGDIAAPDAFIGGTPCQAFSVAGKRKGLADARGNLSLTFCGIADTIDAVRRRNGKPPCAILWENVPGVLSDKGNAFGCFLGEMAGSGCELQPPGGRWGKSGCVFGPRRVVAWRVLDSQWFGVAQRRKRVFVVASAGDGCRPEEILLVEEGVRRDSPPSREKREGVTYDLAPSLTSSGRSVARAGETRGQDPVVAVCPTLRAGGNSTGGHRPPGTDVDTCDSLIPVHTTGTGYWREGVGTLRGREQDSHENLMVMAHGQANAEIAKDVYPTLNCNHEAPIATYDMRGNGDGVTVGTLTGDHAGRPTDYTPVVCTGNDLAHTLRGEGFDASEDGTGRGTPLAVAFSCKDNGRDASNNGVTPCLRAMGGTRPNGGGQIAVAFAQNQAGEIRTSDICGTLNTNTNASGRNAPLAMESMHVRRLTPRECERLQGLPDDWTLIPWRGKPAADCPDGPRYKGIGNGQTVNVMRWLAARIHKSISSSRSIPK